MDFALSFKKRIDIGLLIIGGIGLLMKLVLGLPVLPILLVFLIVLPLRFSKKTAFKYLTIMLPLFILMAFESVLQIKATRGANVKDDWGEAIPACKCAGGILQHDIDLVYGNDLWAAMTPLKDGIRVFHLPVNYRSDFVNTDENGFRSVGIGQKTANTFRILLFGGSAAFGWQAPSDQSTAAEVLKRFIASDYSGWDIEIINMATPNGNYLIDYVNLMTYGQQLDPDMVIFLNGYNDAGGSADNVRRLGGMLRLVGGIAPYPERIPLFRSTLIRWYAAKINVTRWLVEQLDRMNPQWIADEGIGRQNPELAVEDLERYEKEFLEHMELCYLWGKQKQIPVWGFYQPTLVSTALSKSYEMLNDKEKKFVDSITPVSPSRRVDSLVPRMDAMARKHDGRYIDLTGLFGAEAQLMLQGKRVCQGGECPCLFITNSHWTERGNKLVASAIYKHIRVSLDRLLPDEM